MRNEKAPGEIQTLCVVRWSQNFCPAADPVHGGAGCSKFGAAGAYYLHLQTQFGED